MFDCWKTQFTCTFTGLHRSLQPFRLLKLKQTKSRKFPGVRLYNRHSVNWPSMKTSQQNGFVFEVGKTKLLCVFVHLQRSAVACVTPPWPFSFTIWKGEHIKMHKAYSPPVSSKQIWASLTLFYYKIFNTHMVINKSANTSDIIKI